MARKIEEKPVRYWIRDEIEEIIKEENIDRNRFLSSRNSITQISLKGSIMHLLIMSNIRRLSYHIVGCILEKIFIPAKEG